MRPPSRMSFAASSISSMLVPTILVISPPGGILFGDAYIQSISNARANMRHAKAIVIVHGGAGDWPSDLHKRGLNGVRRADDRGFRLLAHGCTSLAALHDALGSV